MDVFKLTATLGLDSSEYESGLNEAKSSASSIGSSIAGGLKNAVAGGIKVIGAAIGTATVAVGALGKSAVESYANYEQLAGGVEKLYGTAADKLKEYADQAYMTAGMSANQYMETATSFSAALINSLGGDVDKAADMTDVAMKAISDNVNVFGSDFESVQMAFQGFAKQNYTMLDNLKLGYGGTKSEMERLIADANEYRESIGETADLSIDSFADVIQAIQSVQEAQNIAGTTNKEAMKTIEGSATATKAAWENVITAIGRGEGLEDALNGLTTAIFGEGEGEGLLNQIIPRIQTVMEGIGTFVQTAAPFITDKLPELIENIVPPILEAGVTLAGALGQGLLDNLPMLLDVGLQIVTQIGGAIMDAAPGLMDGAVQLITILGTFLVQNIPKIGDAITKLIVQMSDMLSKNADGVVNGAIEIITVIATTLIQNLPVILEAVLKLAIAIGEAVVDNAPQIVASLLTVLGQLLQALITWIPTFVNEVNAFQAEILLKLINYGVEINSKVQETLSKLISLAAEKLENLFNTAVEWLTKIKDDMGTKASEAVDAFIKFISELPGKAWQILSDVMTKVESFGSDLWNKAKEIAKNFFDAIVDGVAELPDKMAKLGEDMLDAISDLPDKFLTVGKNIVGGIKQGISDAWDDLKSWFKEKLGSLFGDAQDEIDAHSPSRKFMKIGRWIDQGIEKGLQDEAINVDRTMKEVTGLLNADGVTPNVSFVGNPADFTTAQVQRIEEPDDTLYDNLADAFVKALDRYGLTVQIDNRELGRVVRREVLA